MTPPLAAVALALAVGGWVRVTPETMTRAAPVVYTGLPGSVTRQYVDQRPLSDSCAILDAGRVVGYRLSSRC